MPKSLKLGAIAARFLSPARIFMLSFAGIILAGSIVLILPHSSPKGVRFLDALFMSTSSVCVTGLSVLDVGTELSTTGQVFLLCLMQAGGLGIITFSSFFFTLMGRGISFKGHEIIQSSFLHTPNRDFLLILKWVMISTFVIESVGGLFLFLRFLMEFPPGKALYLALFHAISAFNNCGFALFQDSFIGYQGDLLLNVVVMGLIVLGGIGFVVQYEIYGFFRKRERLSLHSRIAVITTLVLIAAGAVLFYIFEREFTLNGLPWVNQVLASLFQSVTPRTAGFNTVDIGKLTNTSILLLIVLMFIGASPGSTGGGIKTTSFAVLALLIWSRWRGNEEVTLYNRTIPAEVVSRTISIIFASGLCILLVVCIVLLADRIDPTLAAPMDRGLYVEYFFETVSAFGTVGLSMGITPNLNDFQKLAIILMMFVGRVGPLTLAFSMSMSAHKKSIVYAEESVMVG
jgi:trk system potassium uptake protein